jgi:hypothetical protein
MFLFANPPHSWLFRYSVLTNFGENTHTSQQDVENKLTTGSRLDYRRHPAAGEPITRSPNVAATVADSLQLARIIMARLEQG